MTDPAQAPITVLVADDQRLIRAGFRVILDSQPDITVIGEAADGQQAIDLSRQHAPAVVLMDIRMPVLDGLEAARQIVATTSSRVLMLTTFGTDEYVYEALRLGASGFLLKDCPPDQLIAAVRVAAVGDAMIDPTITRRLISAFTASSRSSDHVPVGPLPADHFPADHVPARFSQLTPRELDVIRLLARGLSNLEIARELTLEESTIKTHVARILAKLELRDRVQAVVLAYETGLSIPTRD